MKDPLYGNKVAAAILTTLLLAFGLPITISTLTKVFSHHGHHEADEENPFGLAYIPAEIELGPTAAGEEEEEIDLGTLMANASVERGQRAAGLCGSCHTFQEGEPNGIGPNLWGIVGRDIASHGGFSYSSALQGLEGDWTYERLDPYLENSQAYVPGTQMAQMVRKEEKRADLLAYLGSLSNDPVPYPAPAPAPEETAEAEGDADSGEESGAGESRSESDMPEQAGFH
ncbi:cytochrome C [Parvularcula bermudensis HTCC2503]|uniref:Cytochrome C n=1 Tax=Parvularcula bermudensis (strain ATCC BAA-594 / HTCC2503 / KCTC 12087) TaxID=314260 RepID=E0TE40_PARBH|nr:c-type cytochrome [Parvularcula bermudensis]ADM08861.1 cytochrome C [Parvularcula bermudensis HTCC2503]